MKAKRYRKKIKFGKYYLLSFGLTTLVMLGIGGKHVYDLWMKHNNKLGEMDLYKTQWQYQEDEIQAHITKAEETGDLPYELARLSTGSFFGHTGREYGVIMVNPQTGESIAAEPIAMAYAWQNGEIQKFRTNDRDVIERMAATRIFTDSVPRLHSIYAAPAPADDNTLPEFLPGEVFDHEFRLWYYWLNGIIVEPFEYIFNGKKIPGTWENLTPEVPEGYALIESDESKDEQTTIGFSTISDKERTPRQEKSLDGNAYLDLVLLLGPVGAPHIDAAVAQFKEEYAARYQHCATQLSYLDKRMDLDWITENDLAAEGVSTIDEYIEHRRESLESAFDDLPSGTASYYRWELDNADKPRPGWEYTVTRHDVTYQGETWQLLFLTYVDGAETFKGNYLAAIMIQLILLLPAAAIIAVFFALVTYLIYSKKYDIAEYRRTLTSALAHDLKTPLAVISGYAENLREHTHPEKADSYADGIMSNVQHMDEMIAGVLELSRLEDSAHPDMRDRVDLTALLHEAFLRNETALSQRGLKLTESGSCVLRGNAEMLRQVAENLAANAVQHCAEGGEITVTGEGSALRIANPYSGELDAKTLCEPFTRGDSARGKYSGSGLGLSIVRNITALHKMKCKVTAKEGIFAVTLKGRKPKTAAAPNAAAQPVSDTESKADAE